MTRLGSREDWQGFLENPAINELIARSDFGSAHSVFEFGCGTGALAVLLFQRHLPMGSRYVWAGYQRNNGLARAGAPEVVDRTRQRLSE
jgi:hypothetical protein